ncbi:cyclic nucleotide-binding domain-containing protein [Streptomyces sp. NPDC001832]|uniref:cyclic nucleotide-binding domain-containing protein n=1 Tax=Streptomyces sp. NPDC001832 TaxID=3154527 RepID=UPI0033241FF1
MRQPAACQGHRARDAARDGGFHVNDQESARRAPERGPGASARRGDRGGAAGPRRTLFEEGRRADRFWIIRSGQVEVDLHVPGRRTLVVETVGRDDLLGWSWLSTPHVWHMGAHVIQAGQAVEFDAAAVRTLCEDDAVLGRAVYKYVAETVAKRLYGTRTRLLQLYGPQAETSDA